MRTRTRTPLPDARTIQLSVTPISEWFVTHGIESYTCVCTETGGPDPACDRGQALWRLSEAARTGKLDRYTERAA